MIKGAKITLFNNVLGLSCPHPTLYWKERFYPSNPIPLFYVPPANRNILFFPYFFSFGSWAWSCGCYRFCLECVTSSEPASECQMLHNPCAQQGLAGHASSNWRNCSRPVLLFKSILVRLLVRTLGSSFQDLAKSLQPLVLNMRCPSTEVSLGELEKNGLVDFAEGADLSVGGWTWTSEEGLLVVRALSLSLGLSTPRWAASSVSQEPHCVSAESWSLRDERASTMPALFFRARADHMLSRRPLSKCPWGFVLYAGFL